MRIFSLVLLSVISGCSAQGGNVVAEAKGEDRILCAIGDAQLVDDCAIERTKDVVTVRHIDGSFRRFEIQADGTIATADGADELVAKEMNDGATDVRIGDAHYRFAAEQLP
jgi:hypothetical protein